MRRLALLTFVPCLAGAAPALASRHATPRSRSQMRVAVRHSRLMPPPIRRGRFHLTDARVSTQGPWSKAVIVPNGSLRRRLDSVLAIFRRHGHGWRLASAGTAEVGCGHPRLPAQVRRDLRLGCPAQAAQRAHARRVVRPCRTVRAGGRTAYRVLAHNSLRCPGARRHLRGWLRHGFPHDQTGWYCDMRSRPKLCSIGNGAAPFVIFRLRR